jgi:hypothetical protein
VRFFGEAWVGGSTKHIWPIRAHWLVHLIVYELNLAYIFLIDFIS